MAFLIQLLEVGLPLAYAAIFVLYMRLFLKPEDHTKEGPFLGSQLLYGTLAVHLSYLGLLSYHVDHLPVASRAEFLSVLALCIGLVYAFVERKHRDANTGVFFLPLIIAAQGWSSLLMDHSAPHSILAANPAYGIHVIFMVFGFTALAVSALYALMYILLSRQLKSHQLGLIFRQLPALNILEKMSRLATLCGIILLGIGLGIGHYLAMYVLEYFDFFDPKIVITYVAWAIYAVGYLVVKIRGISGLRMGYLSLAGYLTLITAMVVVNTFLSSFHSFQ
jgi:HemX protein